jgi:hypothetical protein
MGYIVFGIINSDAEVSVHINCTHVCSGKSGRWNGGLMDRKKLGCVYVFILIHSKKTFPAKYED